MNILVTCVASKVIPEIITLIRAGIGKTDRIIGVDSIIKENAVGSIFCDSFYQVPNGSDSGYIEEIKSIVASEKIGLIFPGSDDEALTLSKYKSELETYYYCKVACSNFDTTSLLTNKYLLLNFLKSKELFTGLYTEFTEVDQLISFASMVGYPEKQFIIKPKIGRGSKGFKLVGASKDEREHFFSNSNYISTLDELCEFFIKHPDMMQDFLLMEYFSGEKFSSDILIKNGQVKCIVTRSNGYHPKTNPPTQQADIVFNELVDTYVRKILSFLELDYFLQIETGINENGKLGLIEINPRLDATLPITIGVGVNFYVEMIKYAQGFEQENEFILNESLPIKYFRFWNSKFVKQ